MKVALFPSKTRPQGEQQDLSWAEFCNLHLVQHTARNDKDGALFSTAIYPDNRVQRADMNVVAVWGLVGDIDNSVGKGNDAQPSAEPTLPEDVEHNLDGYAYAVYSTYSHKPGWPKWRLVLPLSRPLLPGEFRAAWDGLHSLLARDKNIDPTSCELSRSFFLPSCPSDMVEHAFHRVFTGELMTPEELFKYADFEPSSTIVPFVNGNSRERAQSVGRNDTLKNVAVAMLERGEPFAEVISEVERTDRDTHNPPLFTDASEGFRADATSGAIKFVSSVLWSINTRRAREGTAPLAPGLRAAPVFDAAQFLVNSKKGKADASPITKHLVGAPSSELLKLPGVLGELVTYINATAPKPQPIFAVTTALALGSVVLGRRWCTAGFNNFSSLYFLNIGKTGSGKEYARKVVHDVLRQSKLAHLLGPGGYSSEAAVLSALLHKPVHIAIMDEFGMMLASTQNDQGSHARTALKKGMEAWGAVGSVLDVHQLSTLSANASVSKDMSDRRIERPAMTWIGMSTPEEFYGALTDSSLVNGFLNRFIVTETHIGRQEYGGSGESPVPACVIDWCKRARAAGVGNLSAVEAGADLVPECSTVALDAKAITAWRKFEARCNRRADELDVKGMGDMVMRDAEKVLRVAMIIAVSENIETPRITVAHVEWASKFIEHYSDQLIDAAAARMSGGKFDASCNKIGEFIRTKGAPVGKKALLQFCWSYRGLRKMERVEALQTLEDSGVIRRMDDGSYVGGD